MKPVALRPSDPGPIATPPNAEHVFYHDAGAFVSLARVVVGSQTFALANISSVACGFVPPARGAKIMCLVLAGILLTINTPAANIAGCALLTIGVLGLLLGSRTYFVSLTAAGGEVRVLASKDRRRVEAIVNAINEAIVARSSLAQAAYSHAQHSP